MQHNLILCLTLTVLFLSAATLAFGQSFDEQFELWPVDLKINGSVVVSGGIEMPERVVELFAKAAKSDDANPVVIQFGEPNSELAQQIKAQFEDDKELCQWLEVKTSDSDLSVEVVAAIENSTAILFTSSDPFEPNQNKILTTTLTAAKNSVQSGGLVCFNSPFAQSLGRLSMQSNENAAVIQEGDNLIPDSVIVSNYSDEKDRNVLLATLAANPRCVGIGIEQESAIILRGRKIVVAGDGQATFCLMANEQKPLRVLHVKQAQSRRANPYETVVDLTAWRRDAIERTVAPFPESKPPIPLVENGTLMIVGGGGMPGGLMERMVELAGGKEAKLVYIPCTENDEVSDRHAMVEQWKKMGVKSATFIHTKDRIKANSDDEFLSPLTDATGIWFGGGRQWNFSDSYYGTKAHKLMKDVLARGGVIGGSSAGASIQARYMCRANPVANFDIMAPGYERGLGFISGVAIDQHFSQRGRQKDMTQLVNRYPQLLGIGLDEGTAIIVEKSLAEVVGKGKVFFYDRKQPVVPGTDDFLALETGTIFDLERREIVEVDSESESEK